MTRDDLAPDLSRTVALLGDGYRITQLARAKRAQERNEMLTAVTLTADEQARALSRAHYHNKARVAAIVEDAAELVETVGPGDAYTSIAVHSDDLLAAALDLPDAERNDYVASDTGRPAVSCRVGRVTFFGSVR